jgi:hypothetical protein
VSVAIHGRLDPVEQRHRVDAVVDPNGAQPLRGSARGALEGAVQVALLEVRHTSEICPRTFGG